MRSLSIALVLVGCGTSATQTSPDATDSPLAAIDAGLVAIDTPVSTWTWVEIPGTTCANGSPAGIGVNRAATTTNLMIYFEGGGACWDIATCTAQPPLAVNLDVTYDAAHLATDTAALGVDRGAEPFASTTFVFVPYCTGDLHAGTKVTAYAGGPTIHHTGGTNTQAFVDTLHHAFANVTSIWIDGSSAGGYGATLDFHRFTTAWPSASAHLLQDSSPFFNFMAAYDTMQAAWAIAFPPGCTGCTASFTAAFDAVVAAHPTSRIGLLTFDDDAVIKTYFSYTSSLVPVTADLLDHHFDKANTRAYVVAGTGHTMLGALATTTSHGVKLSDWVVQWLLGTAGWTTVR